MFGIGRRSAAQREGFGKWMERQIGQMVQDEFLHGIYGIHPDVVMDMMATREKGAELYDVWESATSGFRSLTRDGIMDTLASGCTVGLLLTEDMVMTKFLSYLSDKGVESAIASKLSLDASSGVYDFRDCGNVPGGYGHALVSVILGYGVEGLSEAFGPALKRGAAIIRTVDRIIPLTNFVLATTRQDCNTFCVEQRENTLTMWNMANVNGHVVPVNSRCIKLPFIMPEKSLETTINALRHEFVRIHKFESPKSVAIIADGKPMLSGMWKKEQVMETCRKVLQADDIQVIPSGFAAVKGMIFTEEALGRSFDA